jgi:hypothetical protein
VTFLEELDQLEKLAERKHWMEIYPSKIQEIIRRFRIAREALLEIRAYPHGTMSDLFTAHDALKEIDKPMEECK